MYNLQDVLFKLRLQMRLDGLKVDLDEMRQDEIAALFLNEIKYYTLKKGLLAQNTTLKPRLYDSFNPKKE